MLSFKKTKYISLNQDSEKGKVSDSKEAYVDRKINGTVYDETEEKGPAIPTGAWIKCDSCGELLFHEDVEENMDCCPKCGMHFRIDARKRIEYLADEGSFVEWDADLMTENVLNFPDYEHKIRKMQKKTRLTEAVVTGVGKISGYETVIASMDANFMMGSMGHVVGEKITRAVERATEKKLPIIIFTTSGGARMQEGMVSLMQMAKTSAALKKHSEAGQLYITVLTDPTTGGVTASFAMLGDIILAEPGALIGFAGPRVIEQTIRQKLPDGFQRAEFLLAKGFVDKIVPRTEMKEELALLLKFHS